MAAKKRGLGRGLEALLGGDAEPVPLVEGEGELRTLVIATIQPGRYQPRHAMDPERLDDLAASIKAQGVIQPIVVRTIARDRYELIAGVRHKLGDYAPIALGEGLTIVIENHQDFTSRELVAFCEKYGPSVRIVYDVGNSFPVAEAPLDFTRVIAPYVAHVHLKDYRAQWTDEGYRLVRCAIGDGAVPFTELVAILGEHHSSLTAVLEPGALEARHVRLFTPDWWKGYAPKRAEELAACLKAARRNRLADDADYRTPWERGADDELSQYELDMIRRSAANMKALGLM